MTRWFPLLTGLLIFLGYPALAPALVADEDRTCLDCHLHGTKSRRHVDLAQLKASVHWGEASCVQCHPGATDMSHGEYAAVVPADCGSCHEKERHHGLESGKPAHCSDCHGGHDVLPASHKESRLHMDRVGQTCGRCHPDEFGTGSVQASVLSFRLRGHAKADPSRSYASDNCLACHHQDVAHETGEQPLVQDCRMCHNPDASRTLLLGTFHGGRGSTALWDSGRIGDALYLGLTGVFVGIFSFGWFRRFRTWTRGGPAPRWDRPVQRFSGLVKSVLGQGKLFDRKTVGIGHYLIFLGVGVPILMIVAAQFQPAVGTPLARMASLVLDVLGLGLLVGLSFALVRRVQRPEEYPPQGAADIVGLVLLFLVVITGFLAEALRLATVPSAEFRWSPVGGLLASALPSSPSGTSVTWRIHLLTALGFLSILSWTRLRHLVTAPLNIFFRNLGPMGRIEPVRVDSGERFGVTRATDLAWKDLLDSDSCVECGRCQEVCPAYATEKPLSPMKVVLDIRSDAGSLSGPSAGEVQSQDLLNGRVSPDEAWACATCYACQEACPVLVEHVGKLTGLRRGLLMDRGRAPREAVRFLRNLEVFGDPAGYGPALRWQWTQGLPRRSLTKPADATLLFWVGCQAAFHPRAREIAQALVTVAGRAGVRLAILGDAELCCGDPARRVGDEALFQEMAQRNIECFNDHGVSEIVTGCPHCFNTLTNEYGDFGARIRVVHAVEWAAGLVSSGRLSITGALEQSCAFHDPCYLSRVNGLSHFPRLLAKAVRGLQLREMERSQEQTFCCGAGGGHMWLHETGTRINQARAEQCMRTSADLISTACPYCVTMLEDGLQEVSSKPAKVLDLIEIVEMVTR